MSVGTITMAPPKILYLICFDIVNDRTRNKVAKVLEGYGDRVQKSVFECTLSKTQLKNLQGRIERLIQDDEDSVHFYRLCNRCLEGFECIGLAHTPEKVEHKVI